MIKNRTQREDGLQLMLMGRRFSLVNIYAPNTDSLEFFHNLHVVIQNMGNTDIIIGGDFYQARHNASDRSSNMGRSNKSQMAIDTISEELGLVDVWRLIHPQERGYTFFFVIPMHHTLGSITFRYQSDL